MFGQKLLYDLAFVNGMAVPHENDRSRNTTEDLLEKGDHLFSGQAVPIGLEAQPNSFSIRRNQQHAQEIKTLVMFDAGADDRCLTAASPAALER